MRAIALVVALVATSCTVPEKAQPEDAGVDAGAAPDAEPEDRAAPETTISSGPDALTRSTGATFEFGADEPATFTCRFDSTTPFECESPLTRTFGDANHTFTVRATDLAGNPDETPAEHVWTIDTVAPQTTITMAPPAADNSVTVRFNFVANDATASFDCSVDGGAYAPCTSGDAFGPLGDGAHSFAVRARDAAGNLDSTPAIHAWAIDSSTPDTEILSGPDGSTASPMASFTFYSADAGGGATFQCDLDGAGFVSCTSPRGLVDLVEGMHTFQVRVRDAVGNLDPTPATRSWTVDLTPPDTSIESGPSETVPMASGTFAFAASEEGVVYECAVDGGPWAACANPTTLTSLAQGSHTLSVRAIDLAGHVDATPAQRTWTVDTIGPVVSIDSPAPGSTSGPYISFGFTVSEGAPTCGVDGAQLAPCTSPATRNLAAGSHTFAVQASDPVGNVTTVSRGWTVACAPPTGGTGMAGLFHLDEGAVQTAVNAAGGADAVLGTDATVETSDPARLATARFGGGLGLVAAEGDRVTWPAGIASLDTHTIELWIRPAAGAGSQDVVVSGDGRIALRVIAGASNAQVRYTIATGGAPATLSSAGIAVGQWHHVLASFEEPTMRLWVDGVRVEASNVDPGASLAGASFVVGGASGFGGDVDELYVSGTAITADDAALPRYCPM